MFDQQVLAGHFEGLRPHLSAVAYRMLGSVTEAEDAVQEGWLRLTRDDPAAIDDLRGWLTVTVGRICLDILKRRQTRREYAVGTRLPEILLTEDTNPASTVIQDETVGLALLVVQEALPPAARLAFVLHDIFAVSFDEIAGMLGRSPAGVRQLASRARRHVRHRSPPPADPAMQRRLVSAFLAASRAGDFTALLSVLHEDAVFRADLGADQPTFASISRAEKVARHVLAPAPDVACLSERSGCSLARVCVRAYRASRTTSRP